MSGGSNQRTLFQTWGGSVPQNDVVQPKKGAKKAAGRTRPTPATTAQVGTTHPPRSSLWSDNGQKSTCTSEDQARTEDPTPVYEDEDDDLMVVAAYEAESSLQLDNVNSFQDPVRTDDTPLSPTPSCGKTYPDFPGFDSSSARVWIYPTNYPIREYQLKISEAALFKNTLVCLPTGLGKTFIASVIMYNFYRWYPSGKIVFMAPTKPLVAQQIEACYKVMGIPQAHMAELTGSTAAKQRQEVWKSKRVFFLTPQVMVNDLSRDTCPAQQIKCVVIDEAHKALGNHAYCQVIRQLTSQTLQFRILALSATPGGDAKSVQSVISNLLIAHIELRSEESPDIQAHSHQRNVEKVVVPLGEVLSAYQARYLEVLGKFMSRLVQNRVMGHKDLRTLSKYQLILARDQFRKNPPPSIKGPQQGMLEGDFALCISLYHGYELLMQMGLRSLFFYIQGIMDGSREMSRAKNELQRTPTFTDLYSEMETMFVKPSAGPDEAFIYSHPKLEKLEEVVLRHFRQWAEGSANSEGSDTREVSTRVMIFSSFRESVQEIAAMLDRHAPLIKVMTFMGQASAGKGVKGFTQKEQLEVVQKFRQGGFNTLVSTCVGEEGLDIGEVDLIVCFDAQKNPIRLVQRMGRTGRKRQGRIVVVLAEGREERTYNQSQSNKRSVYKSILGNKSGFHLYPNSPRMLPEGVTPRLHKMYITCGQFDHREGSRRSARGRRSNSEGRASLIHPQNMIQRGRATSDGFLSSEEYSLWASTMKLEEHEPHPTLKQSHFMSIPGDPPPQEDVSKGGPPSRELSLWEWRHWQHKALPTHAVDHSLRCNHFIKLMELIDGMKEESEGECRYEQELLPHLHKLDAVKSGQKKLKATKIRTKTKSSRPSWSELEYIDEDEETQTEALVLKPPVEHTTEAPHGHIEEGAVCSSPSKDDFPVADLDVDCVFVNEVVTNASNNTSRDPENVDNSSQLNAENEEDVELQGMFYLPRWDPAPLRHSDELTSERDESLKVILANVAELLSRSPTFDVSELEKAAQLLPSSPQPPHQPFPVSFTLDVDDDEDDDVMMRSGDDASLTVEVAHHEQQTVRVATTAAAAAAPAAASSPNWDELFEDEDVEDDHNARFDMEEADDEICDDFTDELVHVQDNGEIKGGGTSEGNVTWDEVRGEEMPDGGGSRASFQMDESIDLFEDDEAFLQMTIPDIPTPEDGVTPRTSPDATGAANSKEMTVNTSTSPSTQSTAHRLNTKITSNPKLLDHNTTETELNTPAQAKPGADKSLTRNMVTPHFKSPTETFDTSHDFFSVNFDLGYSLEDSEDETAVEALPAPHIPAPSPPNDQRDSTESLPAVSNSSTPFNSSIRQPVRSGSKISTPQMLSERRMSKSGALPSPIMSPRARRTLLPGVAGSMCSSLKRKQWEVGSAVAESEELWLRPESVCVVDSPSPPHPDECGSDSEEEVVLHKRKHQKRVNPLSSPEMSKICSDVDSPVVVKRKRAAILDISEERDGEAVSDDDFQREPALARRHLEQQAARQRVQQIKDKRADSRRKGCQFLDEEAELSADEEGAEVSSDEEDGEEQDHSLDGFVVDTTQLSQGLNDSDMHGVYLKSVRSPAVQGKFKMSYRNNHNIDIFSQVPEMDETYAEDSFVVGSDEEEPESGEDEAEDVDLIPEASFVDGRRQYATRRRVFLHKARSRGGAVTRAEPAPEQRAGVKTKRTRVLRINDSSEEEMEEVVEEKGLPVQPMTAQRQETAASSASTSLASRVSLLTKARGSSVDEEEKKERCRQRLENQHLLSDELDFVDSEIPTSSKKQSQPLPAPPVLQESTSHASSVGEAPASSGSVCILVDSRCISSGVELMTSLRQRHAAAVHVCSLDGSYFIVSNRMAVERHSQSDLAAMQNRKRLAERVINLQGLFERVCLIVEKDRTKTGEASRPFQRTRYYDSTLAALVRTGIRVLWSDGAEESAGLLADLARLEHRKGQGISVPPEVKGQHMQLALQLYSSLPSVSYVHALNMSHNFKSIAQLINSSIEDIQKGGCMSRPRAEEVYRFLRYSSDSILMNASKPGKS
ncbi:Fanconi anemia group M protein [Mugil cephalus]|uniref:Fanconi anemia group M protein n=1 Tax=Mugil cephalus TaxID=48193 RepID=UPI001FB66A11|nr:Fanconi anemia group M protein [Mugil cephalus]